MEGQYYTQGVPIATKEFWEQMRLIIREEVSKANSSLKDEEKLLSMKEVCSLFTPKITTATLHNWSRNGLVQKHYIGSRVFFKKSEILKATKTLQKYKHTPLRQEPNAHRA